MSPPTLIIAYAEPRVELRSTFIEYILFISLNILIILRDFITLIQIGGSPVTVKTKIMSARPKRADIRSSLFQED